MSSSSHPVSTGVATSAPASISFADRYGLAAVWAYVRTYPLRYRVALVAYALFVPYIGAVLTVLALVNPVRPAIVPAWLSGWLWVPGNAFLTGTLGALLIWLLLPLISTRFATAPGVNWHTYADLRSQRCAVKRTHELICVNNPDLAAEDDEANVMRVACGNAQAYLDHLDEASKDIGLQWLLGHGYIHLWQTLHRAENELVMIEPREMVLRRALKSRLRLAGSEIANRDDLITYGNRALTDLYPVLAPVIVGKPATGRSVDGAETVENMPPESLPTPVARATLQVVQQALKEYRDTQWNSLLEVRNQLLKTTLVTELGAFALLGLAVTFASPGGPVADGIVGAVSFFLVGGVVGGLYSRLRMALEADSAVEDYGLAMARLFATPLFSGLAAVGGVVLTQVLTELTVAEPSAGLVQIFELTPAHLVLAAVFGLVPARFFDRLGQADQQYTNLRSTESMNQDRESDTR